MQSGGPSFGAAPKAGGPPPKASGLAAAQPKGKAKPMLRRPWAKAKGYSSQGSLRPKALAKKGGALPGVGPKAMAAPPRIMLKPTIKGQTAWRTLAPAALKRKGRQWRPKASAGGYARQSLTPAAKQGVAGNGAAEDEEEYDPFSEAPAPHVVEAAKKAARPIPPWRQKNGMAVSEQAAKRLRRELQAARIKGVVDAIASSVPPPLPLPSATSGLDAAIQALMPKAGAPVPPADFAHELPPPKTHEELAAAAQAAAKDWADKRGPSRRLKAAAKLAERHYKRSNNGDESQANGPSSSSSGPKRSVGEPLRPGFTPEVLAKAPTNLQTCRSLMMFLDKKLEEKTSEKPNFSCPEALRASLEVLAGHLGRLEAVVETTGWDARAKRVLDLPAAAKDPAGEAAMKGAKTRAEALQQVMKKRLQEAGEEADMEALIAERQAWEKANLKRLWWAWCAEILLAQEKALLAEGSTVPQPAARQIMGLGDVFQAIVGGAVPPPKPAATA